MRAAIYCRVSTREQAESGTSLDTQEQACTDRAGSLGYEVIDVIREDHTGTELDRPGLISLVDRAERGRYEHLIVYTLDRLYRPKSEGEEWKVFSLIDRLRQAGVDVEFVDSSIPSSGALSGVIQFLRTWQAGQERSAFIERTSRGKRAKAKAGKIPQGSGVGIYGYNYHKDTQKRTINEKQAEIVMRAFELAAVGETPHAIAGTFNLEGIPTLTGKNWHPRTISNMLKRETYKGVTTFFKTKRVGGKTVIQPEKSWVQVPDASPPIVTPQLWATVQETQRRRGGRRASRSYLLSGYMFCGFCGHTMSGHTMNRRYSYYRCPNMLRTVKNPKSCGQRYIRMSKLDDRVWNSISEVLAHPDVIIEELRKTESDAAPNLEVEIESISNRLHKAKDREYRLMRLYESGELDQEMITSRATEIRAEREQMQVELIRAKSDLESVRRIAAGALDVYEVAKRVNVQLVNADFDLKKLALEALQIRVTIHHDQIDISGAVPIPGNSDSNIGHHWTNIGITTCV